MRLAAEAREGGGSNGEAVLTACKHARNEDCCVSSNNTSETFGSDLKFIQTDHVHVVVRVYAFAAAPQL